MTTIPGLPRMAARQLKYGMAEDVINHEQYGLSNKDTPLPLLGGPGMVNEELKYKLISGRVKCRGRLTRLSGTKAHFRDGTTVENIDAVVFATGYDVDFSFVEDEVIAGERILKVCC